MIKLLEVEIDFSNVCTADCMICPSTLLGSGINTPYMSENVFTALIQQLQAYFKPQIIQTGGYGDALLNPNFIKFLRILRKAFPESRIVNYSNFLLFTPEYTKIIVDENLLDELFTRIDSLDKNIFEKSTKLKYETVFANLGYIIGYNDTIPFKIGYNSIPMYYRKCKAITGMYPYKSRFWVEEALAMRDEYRAIQNYFGTHKFVEYYRINQSLWAEFANPELPVFKRSCPKAVLHENVMYCWSNGDIGTCSYDIEHFKTTIGNILQENLKDIWQGEKRKVMKEDLKLGNNEICKNPKCCKLYNDDEETWR
jgi:MoaA/NifB/PqqE/SkfB family radical SAM enzyme